MGSANTFRLRMGVPVATPIGVSDWMAAVSGVITGRDEQSMLETEIKALLDVPFAMGVNSGRAALHVTLEAMKRSSGRREVVIPAFACPSVGRAVVKAGLRAVVCDVGPTGSGLDLPSLEQVLSRETLAVVAAHLYGYPVDISGVLDQSRRMGAYVIEDCAQAFGARLHGSYVGTLADVGIFSFGMSKVLWCMGGGVIVTASSELSERVRRLLSESKTSRRAGEIADVAKFGLLGLILRSHHLGPLDTVWGQLMRGKGDCDDFDVSVLPASHASAARSLLKKLGNITNCRRRNATRLAAALAGCPGITLPQVAPGSEPVFLRFPVVVSDKDAKTHLLMRLRSAGISASEMYQEDSYEAMRGFAERSTSCPHAEYLVQRMLNLPTHAFMRESDLAAIELLFNSWRHESGARANADPVAVKRLA